MRVSMHDELSEDSGTVRLPGLSTYGDRNGIGQGGSGVGLGQERRSQRLDRDPVQFIRMLGLFDV